MPDLSAKPARDGRSLLRDAVFGAIDGAVTTFAIVAGVVGADLSTRVILVLGLANVLADGFSMAAGNYSGTKAELDDLRRLRDLEEKEIALHPDDEMRVLRTILRDKGLEGRLLDEAAEAIARNRSAWIDMLLIEGRGLSPVDPHPMRAARATFAAFLAAGMVPLVPFVLGLPEAFQWSMALTACTFFAVGALKSHWSLSPWWRSGLETLAIGGTAALIAYAVGTMFSAI